MISRFFPALLGTTLAMAALGAGAQEAVIRKNLAERVPQLKAIDEVTKSVIPGLYEIRVNGTEIYYSDAQANYLVQGNIIDVRNRRNLTEERVDKLTAIKFDALPLKDAYTIVRGNGKRKLDRILDRGYFLSLGLVLAHSINQQRRIGCAVDYDPLLCLVKNLKHGRFSLVKVVRLKTGFGFLIGSNPFGACLLGLLCPGPGLRALLVCLALAVVP